MFKYLCNKNEGGEKPMKTFLKVFTTTMIICLTILMLSGCGLGKNQIEQDITDKMKIVEIDNEDVKLKVKKIEIENRKKGKNTDEIDCQIFLENDSYQAYVYYKLNYVYFDGNGWMLEDYSSYKEPSIIPLKGVSEERLKDDLDRNYKTRKLVSKKTDKKTMTEKYVFDVDEKFYYISYSGKVYVTYTFEKNKWVEKIDNSKLNFDVNIDGKWKSRVYYTTTEASPYVLAVDIKEMPGNKVDIKAGMSLASDNKLNFEDTQGIYTYKINKEYASASIEFDLPNGLKCYLIFSDIHASQSIDILPSSTLQKIE